MKKLLSIAAFAALTLSAANAASTVTANGVDNTINVGLDVTAFTLVSLLPISDSSATKGDLTFIGADIDLGDFLPSQLAAYSGDIFPFYVLTNYAGNINVTLTTDSGVAELTHDTYSSATIPVEYGITEQGGPEHNDINVQAGEEITIAAFDAASPGTLDGQTALTSTFNVKPKAPVNTNQLAGHYSQTLNVTVTAS